MEKFLSCKFVLKYHLTCIHRNQLAEETIVCNGCPYSQRYYSSRQFDHSPPEQKWEFHAIYQLVFPHLYSSEVCSRNRLVLTDEDDAEYKSFESLIETIEDFKRSRVMLCTFHGIWMAFKKDLLPLPDVCQYSKLYGKQTICCVN
jgi:hypothetical protein